MKWILIAVVVIVAILLNGFIAKVEDDSPGGFNNPDGKWIDALKKLKLHQGIIWAIAGLIILFLIFAIITRGNI